MEGRRASSRQQISRSDRRPTGVGGSVGRGSTQVREVVWARGVERGGRKVRLRLGEENLMVLSV
jgi:hypothetical protein